MKNRVGGASAPGMVMAPLSDAEIAEIAEALNHRGHAVTAIGLERRGEGFGLVIGEIREVRQIDENATEVVGVNLDAKWSGVSRGVYRLKDRLLVIMDIDRMQDGAGAEDVSAAA